MSSLPVDYKLIRADKVSPQQWRNGGGETRELLTIPNTEDWLLRISLANIATDGPFSAFQGVQRWFTVVEGNGVRLRFADAVFSVFPGSPPITFDGASAPDCALIDGPTRDLNLMTRKGNGVITVAHPNASWDGEFSERGFFSSSPGNFYFAANTGSLSAACEQPIQLDAFSLLWNIGSGKSWFEPTQGVRAGLWLGYSR